MKLFCFKRKTLPKGYIVPIVGGLGGQILGYTLYNWLKNKDLPVCADACDLLNSAGYQLAEKGQGLNRYIWDLGYYGIAAEHDKNIHGKKSSLPRNYKVLHEGGEERAKIYAEALAQIDPRLFPVSEEHKKTIQRSFSQQKLLVVHVRQSDYLNVASLVIRAEQNVDLVKKLVFFKPERLIFVSDGPLDTEELSTKIGYPVESFASPDYFLVHALLRRADILVAANSQFSFTAGLLGGAKVAFFPKNYFGNEHSHLNAFYQKPFNYFAR